MDKIKITLVQIKTSNIALVQVSTNYNKNKIK